MEMMKAAVFEKTGTLVIKEVPKPTLQSPTQVMIQVEAASICGTDVHIVADPPGYIATPNTILGHEFCGWIVEKGEAVRHLEIGDRVVVNPNNYCGVCTYCRKNLPNFCQNIEALGIDYDGAFARYCVVDGKVAHRISPEIPAEAAASAEPLACAMNAMNKINVKPGDTAVVIGGGPIGLILAMLLRRNGAEKTWLLETSPYRAEFARSKGIAHQVINPLEEDARRIILEATGIGADVVVDVTGSQVITGIDLVRKGGLLVLFGVNAKARAELAQSRITQGEIRVQGTWLANATFPDAVQAMESGVIDLGELVTDVISLDELHAGIAKLAKGQAVKVIVKP